MRLVILLICLLVVFTRTIQGLRPLASSQNDHSLEPSRAPTTFLETSTQLFQDLPHHALKSKRTASAKQKSQHSKSTLHCPPHYIADTKKQTCKCPTGTSGMARASPLEATLHETASKDSRCCRAMGLPSDCSIPCCFCIETAFPFLTPQDCESKVALQQVAWWRRKKAEHEEVTRKVAQLKAQLAQAKAEEQALEKRAAEIKKVKAMEAAALPSSPPPSPSTTSTAAPPPPRPSIPVSTAAISSPPPPPPSSSLSSPPPPPVRAPPPPGPLTIGLAAADAALPSVPPVYDSMPSVPPVYDSPAPVAAKTEAEVKKDVKSLFMSSVI